MIFETLMRLNFDLKKRLKFYRMLAKSTDEKRKGVKIQTALEHLMRLEKRNYGEKSLTYKMYKNWLKKLTHGYEFGKIIRNFAPQTEAMIISASETSGKISDGFILAGDVARSQATFIKVFRSAIAVTSITLVMSLTVLSFFCTKVLPSIASSVSVDRMSNYSLFVLRIIKTYHIWFPAFTISAIILLAFIVWAVPNYKHGFRLKLEKIPPFSLYRIVTGCSFLYAFRSLTKSGVPQTQALKRMAEFANPYLKYRIDKILYQMNRGISFGNALINIHLNFPDRDIVDELSIHSESGNIDEALDEVVNNLNEDGLELVKLQAEITKYIGMGIIVVIILFLITGLFSFIKDIQNASMG